MDIINIVMVVFFLYVAASDIIAFIRKNDYKGLRFTTAIISIAMAIYVFYSLIINSMLSLNKVLYWLIFIVSIILSIIFMVLAIRVNNIDKKWCYNGGILAFVISALLLINYFISHEYCYSIFIIGMAGMGLSSMDEYIIKAGIFRKSLQEK